MSVTEPPMESQMDEGYDGPTIERGPEAFEPTPHDAATDGFAPETVDVLHTLSDEQQQKLADRVFKHFEIDWKSMEGYRRKRESIFKLAIGMMPAREDGSEASAEVHYPIIMTAVQRMQARIYDQQFPSNGEFFGVKPTDALDLERTVRVAKHLNWQIAHQIPEYVPNHDILITMWLMYGSAFSYVYWDATNNRPCHEVCATEDIVLPYKRRSKDPSLSDVPRITRILRPHMREIEDNAYYSPDGIAKLKKALGEGDGQQQTQMDQTTSGRSSDSTASTTNFQDTIDKAAGMEKPLEYDEDAPRELLEQHRWFRFPGEAKDRPIIACIDKVTKTLLCLRIREDEDPRDRARYNREKKANELQYQAALQQYQMDYSAYVQGQMQPPMGMGQPTMTPPPMPGQQDMTQPPQMPGPITPTAPMMPPPQMPEPPPNPTAPKMVPINFFTHYICIPNPEGIFGFGIGYLLEGHNMVADVIASQIVDAGTLANSVTGWRSRQAKLRGGELEIKPGKILETDLQPQDLEKGIHILKFPGPDPQLAAFIKDQKEEAQELSGANEILSGEVGGSNETATTTQIRISQALAAIAILNKRYTRARTVEGQKFVRLNSVHLGDDEYFTVVDPFKQTPSNAAIARMDYLEDVDITPTADPRMASQPQRIQEAMQAFNLVASAPMLAQNPMLMHEVARNVFIAMDRPELVRALEAMPPMMPMMGGPPQPGQPGQQPPNGQPPKNGGSPKPEPTSPPVPNGGPTPPNGPFMGQGA